MRNPLETLSCELAHELHRSGIQLNDEIIGRLVDRIADCADVMDTEINRLNRLVAAAHETFEALRLVADPRVEMDEQEIRHRLVCMTFNLGRAIEQSIQERAELFGDDEDDADDEDEDDLDNDAAEDDDDEEEVSDE